MNVHVFQRHRAPPSLRRRVAASLGGRTAWARLRERLAPPRGSLPWRHALPFAAGALVGMLAMSAMLARGAGEALGREVVSSHVRSLADGHISDVASSDREVLMSWFQGRLHYSPEVRDLSAAGYALVGARIDYVGDRFVAAVVYLQGRHFINLFACPLQAARTFDGSLERAGFTALGWRDDARQYWAVADLDPGQLQAFAAALRGERGATGMH